MIALVLIAFIEVTPGFVLFAGSFLVFFVRGVLAIVCCRLSTVWLTLLALSIHRLLVVLPVFVAEAVALVGWMVGYLSDGCCCHCCCRCCFVGCCFLLRVCLFISLLGWLFVYR